MRTTCLVSSLSPSSSPAVARACGCDAPARVWLSPADKAKERVTERGRGGEAGAETFKEEEEVGNTCCAHLCPAPTYQVPGIGRCTQGAHSQLRRMLTPRNTSP